MTITALHAHRRAAPARPVVRTRLTVTAHHLGPDRLTLCVAGEVDACNAKDFAVAVCEQAAGHPVVDVDLSALGFAGVDAISALHAINAHMLRHDVSWLVVPGKAVGRLLDLCDPEELIPRTGADPATEAEPA